MLGDIDFDLMIRRLKNLCMHLFQLFSAQYFKFEFGVVSEFDQIGVFLVKNGILVVDERPRTHMQHSILQQKRVVQFFVCVP